MTDGAGTAGVASDGVNVDAVAAAVAACPSVVRLSGGVLGEVATYLPGRRVTGVRVADGVVEVHIVVRWVDSLPAVGDEICAAVGPMVGGRPVTVFIDDLAEQSPPGQPGPLALAGGADGR